MYLLERMIYERIVYFLKKEILFLFRIRTMKFNEALYIVIPNQIYKRDWYQFLMIIYPRVRGRGFNYKLFLFSIQKEKQKTIDSLSTVPNENNQNLLYRSE